MYTNKDVVNVSNLKVFNMRYPKELLNRIDNFKEMKGFSNRTQTIIYLIQRGLDEG